MRLSNLLCYLPLATLIRAEATNTNAINIHTDDVDALSKLNLKRILDIENTLNINERDSNHDGSDWKLAGVYFHAPVESIDEANETQTLKPITGSKGLRARDSWSYLCPKQTCFHGRKAKFANEDQMTYWFPACDYINDQMGEDWRVNGTGISFWWNNARCNTTSEVEDGFCSLSFGVEVLKPPSNLDASQTLLSQCHGAMIDITHHCHPQGGTATCKLGDDGTFRYWSKPFARADMGYRCDGVDSFTSLKCAHAECSKESGFCTRLCPPWDLEGCPFNPTDGTPYPPVP